MAFYFFPRLVKTQNGKTEIFIKRKKMLNVCNSGDLMKPFGRGVRNGGGKPMTQALKHYL